MNAAVCRPTAMEPRSACESIKLDIGIAMIPIWYRRIDPLPVKSHFFLDFYFFAFYIPFSMQIIFRIQSGGWWNSVSASSVPINQSILWCEPTDYPIDGRVSFTLSTHRNAIEYVNVYTLESDGSCYPMALIAEHTSSSSKCDMEMDELNDVAADFHEPYSIVARSTFRSTDMKSLSLFFFLVPMPFDWKWIDWSALRFRFLNSYIYFASSSFYCFVLYVYIAASRWIIQLNRWCCQ